MSVAAQFINPQPASDSKAIHQRRSTMNAALWTRKYCGGVSFSFTGFGKILMFNAAPLSLPRESGSR